MKKRFQYLQWESIYRRTDEQNMIWFNHRLDPDFDAALCRLNIHSGTVLDIGTGTGSQAIALAERGFSVTATDISDTAVEKAASKTKSKSMDVVFMRDNILRTRLTTVFDIVTDRGCFHSIPSKARQLYLDTMERLIKPEGYLLLKCFRHQGKGRYEGTVYSFSAEEINQIFRNYFNVCLIEKTIYNGVVKPSPKMLFCVLRRL